MWTDQRCVVYLYMFSFFLFFKLVSFSPVIFIFQSDITVNSVPERDVSASDQSLDDVALRQVSPLTTHLSIHFLLLLFLYTPSSSSAPPHALNSTPLAAMLDALLSEQRLGLGWGMLSSLAVLHYKKHARSASARRLHHHSNHKVVSFWIFFIIPWSCWCYK